MNNIPPITGNQFLLNATYEENILTMLKFVHSQEEYERLLKIERSKKIENFQDEKLVLQFTDRLVEMLKEDLGPLYQHNIQFFFDHLLALMACEGSTTAPEVLSYNFYQCFERTSPYSNFSQDQVLELPYTCHQE